MCQRLMGSHCRLQPGSNTECKSGRGAGEVERRTEVKGEEADIFSLVSTVLQTPIHFSYVCLFAYAYNIHVTISEYSLMKRTEWFRPNVCHEGKFHMVSRPGCHAQWALRMILCPNVTPVGRGLFSEAPLMTSSSNPQPKGFQAPCAAPPGGLLTLQFWAVELIIIADQWGTLSTPKCGCLLQIFRRNATAEIHSVIHWTSLICS